MSRLATYHAKRDRAKQPEFPRAEVSHAEHQEAQLAMALQALAFFDASGLAVVS